MLKFIAFAVFTITAIGFGAYYSAEVKAQANATARGAIERAADAVYPEGGK